MARVIMTLDATSEEAQKIMEAIDGVHIDWGLMPPSVAWSVMMERFPNPGPRGWKFTIRTEASAAEGDA